MDVCSYDCVLSILVIGIIWGATNPLLRLGSAIAASKQPSSSPKNKILQIISDFWHLFRCWQFSIPFALNQAASILFNFLVAKFPISVVVPTTNALQLVSTAVCGQLLGEKQSHPRIWLGYFLTIFGIILMLTADGQPVVVSSCPRSLKFISSTHSEGEGGGVDSISSRSASPASSQYPSSRQERRAALGSGSRPGRCACRQNPTHSTLILSGTIHYFHNNPCLMVSSRQRFPSATYHSAGDECWTRGIYAEQTIAVHDQQHAVADIARHVAEKLPSADPFFVMDVPSVLKAVDLWQANMDRFSTRYALRCNGDPVLAQILAETADVGFEVQNEEEATMALGLVDPSKIVYNNPVWTKGRMKRAGEAEIGTVVVSSEKELSYATLFAPYAKILIVVAIPGCLPRQEAAAVNQGCSIEETEELLKTAYETCANFDGFAFNVDNRDSSAYFKAFKYIKDLWNVAQQNGLSPKTISVGGGFRSQEKTHFQEVTRDLHDAVERFFPQEDFPFLNLVATPGRFFATAAFSFCTNVVGKEMIKANETLLYRYLTNESIYGAFGCRLADVELQCKPLKEKSHDEKETYGLVTGPTNDPMELHKMFVSRQLSVGEWLFWENMGAYSMEDTAHPVYYFTGKDNWELINKRRYSHQQLETISDVGSDGVSDVVTDDEDDLGFDALFPY